MVVLHALMVPEEGLKTADRNRETPWRAWAIVLVVMLGVPIGAVAAGRIKLPILW